MKNKMNTSQKTLVGMLCFGVIVGAVFPFYAVFFMTFKPGMALYFVVGCLIAGGMVGFGSFAVVKLIAFRKIASFASLLKDMADGGGHLSRRLRLSSTDEIGVLAQRIDAFAGMIETVIKSIRGGSRTLGVTSSQLMDRSVKMMESASRARTLSHDAANATQQATANITGIASAAQEMSNSVTTVASSIEEMTSAISEVSRSSVKELEIAHNVRNKTSSAADLIKDLQRAASEIGKITQVIDDIAEKTNLLALNARIESASAGEAGKGFAVVANEIKDLANKTSKSTLEIGKKIEDMQTTTGRSVNAILEALTAIGELDIMSQTLSSAMEEQSATVKEVARVMEGSRTAATEISRNMQEAAHELDLVSKSIKSMSESAASSAASTVDTSIDADIVAETGSELQATASRFIAVEEVFDIAKIKNAHLNWRRRIERALKGIEVLRPSDVRNEHECDFGKWFDSDGTSRFGRLDVFAEIGKHHGQIHSIASQIASLLENKNEAEAKAVFARFEEARRAMFKALDRLYAQ
jgi:methyl-accepting chemotaxis protein